MHQKALYNQRAKKEIVLCSSVLEEALKNFADLKHTNSVLHRSHLLVFRNKETQQQKERLRDKKRTLKSLQRKEQNTA